MNCSELEHYLEAFIEQRLGRNRQLALRRHLARCPHCRAHVQKLCQFERDIHRRLRSMETNDRLWRALELELVQDGHPPHVNPQPKNPPPALPSPEHVKSKIDRENGNVADVGRRRQAMVPRNLQDGVQRTSWAARIVGFAILVAALSAILNVVTGHLGGF